MDSGVLTSIEYHTMLYMWTDGFKFGNLQSASNVPTSMERNRVNASYGPTDGNDVLARHEGSGRGFVRGESGDQTSLLTHIVSHPRHL